MAPSRLESKRMKREFAMYAGGAIFGGVVSLQPLTLTALVPLHDYCSGLGGRDS